MKHREWQCVMYTKHLVQVAESKPHLILGYVRWCFFLHHAADVTMLYTVMMLYCL